MYSMYECRKWMKNKTRPLFLISTAKTFSLEKRAGDTKRKRKQKFGD